MQDLHLAIAFDRNYLIPFYALVTSVLHNNSKNHIVVHAIATGLSIKEKEDFHSYFTNNNATIHFYQVDEEFVKQFVITNEWTSAVYYRLFFPLLVSADVKRLLYLDTDILVLDDLTELYQWQLNDHPVAAVYDVYVKTAHQIGIRDENNYFNSGVLLIDVEQWKRQRISEKAFEYLSAFPERILFVDQDALNAVLIGNWEKLPFRFNTLYSYLPECMSRKEVKAFLNDKVIIHFTLERPWRMLCRTPLRFLYYQYLKMSPLKAKSKYADFALKDVPQFFKIRFIEFYHNMPFLKGVWQALKANLMIIKSKTQ
jgi:lipopolysaccharide biosynthesis glycosyltransferase